MNRRFGDIGRRTTIAALLACLYIAGCTIPVQRNDWSAYTGPGAEYFQREEYELPYNPDPLEPANRVFTGVNIALLVAVVDPVATGWRFAVPQPARTGLVNASNNIEYPRRAVNHLLQGRHEAAASETHRFAVNSTVGVGGLGDPAAEKGVAAQNTDTGMTLNQWGWRDSTYLTIPFGQPGTVRDTVGGIGDSLLDPTTYLFPLGLIKGFVVFSERAADYKRFVVTSNDPYDLGRRMWTAQRHIVNNPAAMASTTTQPALPLSPDDPNDAAVDDITFVETSATDDALASATAVAPTDDDDTAALETVSYSALAFQDPWFPYRAETRHARIPSTGRRLPYDIYLQPVRSPVVFLVPGFGGHRQARPITALVELFYDAGNTVVAVSSPTNFEFMRSAATVTVPGYLPADARDLHAALDAVWRDFYRHYGGRVYKRQLVGSSLGGSQVLEVAAREGETDLIDFDAYLAIDPPVQLQQAAETLDAYYNTPLEYPEAERDERVMIALQKAVRMNTPGRPTAGGAPLADGPLTPDEARFLIGLFYRLALHDVIWVSQERLDQGVLKTKRAPLQRAAASQEILDFSMMEYAYAFLLPQMEKRDEVTSIGDLFANSDLRSLEAQLRAQPKARVVCNANDVLLTPDDVAWMRGIFGDRIVVHETGGHMGNLADADVRASILAMLDTHPTNAFAASPPAGASRYAWGSP